METAAGIRRTAQQGGLEGVEVADTQLSHVDGERGRLVIRGFDVQHLAAQLDFEAAQLLVRTGQVPGAQDRSEARAALGRARANGFARLESLGEALRTADGMDALRGATAQLGSAGISSEALMGALATFAAAWWRGRQGLPALAPDPAASHSADYLRMVRGRAPTPAEVAGLDAYLVTVIDHGMNASTFAARVVASTGSDRVSAVVAGIGALKGPLHGGAPGPVLDMLDAVGSADRAEGWLRAELDAGRRLMGMGHRVYRVRDPRAEVLELAIERLGEAGGGGARLELARWVEATGERLLHERHPDRRLRANVEFYTAVLLEALGLPRELFTPTFAVGRVAGWCAHVEEQARGGRLIRPTSRYVGPMPAEERPVAG